MAFPSDTPDLGRPLQAALRTPYLRIRGARTHNLQNIDLDIPREQLVVITGLSGSGKSSLAFDTLYAEGQRRYVESLSSYARQFLGRLDPPDVDAIEGLSPAIAIEQKATSHNPRSTVGTVTEVHDYLRLLFARAGTPHCPTHGLALAAQTVSQMVDALLALPEGTRLMLLAPLARQKKGEFSAQLAQLQAQGYVRFRVDGQLYAHEDLPALHKNEKHDLDVVIDRVKVRADLGPRLAESVEAVLRLGAAEGAGRVLALEMDSGREHVFSSRFACPACSYSLPELEPRLFSFNSPSGACPACDGLGQRPTPEGEGEGAVSQPCPECQGARLRPEARHVLLGAGAQARSLPALSQMALADTRAWFAQLQLQGARAQIAAKVVHEISARLGFLCDVGLPYLSLARSADTLSGGEAQRIRLASQIGAGLTGVMYVLDEPSIGLHQRDNERLIATLTRLRDLGNSVIVVEHDEDMIRAADFCVDMGPGAGVHGGRVMAQGHWQALCAQPDSLTGQYLSGARCITLPAKRQPWPGAQQCLRIEGASGHNLQGVTVDFPVGLLTCVTGVSGSGKSTLVNDTLLRAAAQHIHRAQEPAAPCQAVRGLEHFDKVISVDQSPIGRTPRSNPATYTGLFTPLRELLAQTTTARERGYGPARFSFNVAQAAGGGRCEACQGDGVVKVAMHFLPDLYVPCDICHGQRYNRETLQVQWKGKNVAEILALTVQEAFAFFQDQPPLARKLQTLLDVGLAYLRLGQSATTLSGGEAQRVKLALELSRRDTGRTLYVLDEPTTGLHFADIELLLKVLRQLQGAGNTLIVIEHNLDVIKTADWIIDMGPEGGSGGGQVVAVGTPEHLASQPASHTGRYLGRYLAPRPITAT